MDKDRLNRWLTLGANFGVLAGIGLLAYEINQATLTTRAEMISNHQDRWVTMDLSWQDSEIASAWATAMETPEELTVTEMVQLNGLMWSFFDHVATTRTLWRLGILDNPDLQPENIYVQNAYIFFGNKYSRAWIEENRHNLSPLAMETIDQLMEETSEDETLEMYNRIKERIVN